MSWRKVSSKKQILKSLNLFPNVRAYVTTIRYCHNIMLLIQARVFKIFEFLITVKIMNNSYSTKLRKVNYCAFHFPWYIIIRY